MGDYYYPISKDEKVVNKSLKGNPIIVIRRAEMEGEVLTTDTADSNNKLRLLVKERTKFEGWDQSDIVQKHIN